ncbi:MAG: hypothetical protein WCL42_08945 [Chlorobiaceae bacterium]
MQKDRSKYILDEIEKRHVELIPRWRFLVKRLSFWLLAAISVVTGGLAMATAIYVFIDNDFIADHDYIHRFFTERPLVEDIISSIPYVWLAALALFTLVAFFGFRHTKTGYRYSAPKVIAASLGASLLLSLCLNTVDVGGYIHRYLIENVHVYNNLINANEQRWTNSQKGLLGGKVIQLDKVKQLIVLRDFSKGIWRVDISKAEVRPKTPIAPGRYLKITGIKTGRRTFQALSIQSWEKKYHKHPPAPATILPPQSSPVQDKQ